MTPGSRSTVCSMPGLAGRRRSPCSTAPTCRRRRRGGSGTPSSGRGTAAGSGSPGGASRRPLAVRVGKFRVRPRVRPALQRPRAERLRPPAGRVAELAAQEPDHRVGDVELARVGLEVLRAPPRRRRGAAPGRRPPSTTGSPSPAGRASGRRRRSSPRSARSCRPARARSPAAAGSTAARPGSRGGTPARSATRRPDSNGAYTLRTASQYGSRSPTACNDSPVARSVWSVAATSDDSDGCDVVPAIDATAASTASTPASIAAISVASWPPGRVVGVQVDRQVEPLAQRGDQPAGGRRAQQAGHVLDRQDVRARPHDLLGEAQVVVERVEALGRIGQVTGVAQGHLRHGRSRGADRVDRRPHLVDVVERVEDPEDVHPRRRGLLHERRRSPRPGTACTRRCCARAAASACRCSAPPRAARPAAPTGLRRGTAARRRTWRRPSTPATAAAGPYGPRRGATASRSRVRTRVATRL